MRNAVPRFITCDHVAPGCTVSSNKFFLLSLPMKFFGEDDGLGEVAHRPPQPPAFAPQIEICLLLGYTVPMLQNAFGAFDDFSSLESALHFERFGNQPGVLECERRLAGDSLSKSDFFRRECPAVVRIDIQGSDHFQAG